MTQKTSRLRNRSNQLKLDTQMSNEWTEYRNSKKLYNKIRSIPSKSSVPR